MITKQSAMVDDLNLQIEKLKEINQQIEYSWAEKFREMHELHKSDFEEMKHSLTDQLNKEKRSNIDKAKDMVTEFK